MGIYIKDMEMPVDCLSCSILNCEYESHMIEGRPKECPLEERPTGSWISRIVEGTWMLECSVCGCRVQEEKYRTAVGLCATKCPYCCAELGLGGYSYVEYADRRSHGGSNE